MSFFNEAVDVFDHYDGIIYDESCRDGERHQGEIVEGVAEQIHHAESADNRERHGHAGNDGGGHVPQENEDHHYDEGNRQQQFKFNILY